MSWREGFFSFEEQEVSDAPAEANIRISTESLLMEGARRIDEWSRIEGKVAHLGVVPVLAPVADDHPRLSRSASARVGGARRDRRHARPARDRDAARAERVRRRAGRVRPALDRDRGAAQRRASGRRRSTMARRPRRRRPSRRSRPRRRRCTPASRWWRSRSASASRASRRKSPRDICLYARVLNRLGRQDEAARAVARGIEADPLNAELHAESGYCAAWCGDYLDALASWERSLRLNPGISGRTTNSSRARCGEPPSLPAAGAHRCLTRSEG